MPESKLHGFLKQEILPYYEESRSSFLYMNLEVWFTHRIDRKLGYTMHRPDIYYYCSKKNVRKNVLLLGEIETGGGNFEWNLKQTEPILRQRWADNMVLFQVFFPTCHEYWIDTAKKEGRKLEKKYKRAVHYYPFEMKIDEERAKHIRESFRKGRKTKNDLKVLRREINRINEKLLEIVENFLVY